MDVGDADGEADRDGDADGEAVGDRDADRDGDADGEAVGDRDADGDGDAVGDADLADEDVPDAEAETGGVPCPVEEPRLIAPSSAVSEGVGWPVAGEA